MTENSTAEQAVTAEPKRRGRPPGVAGPRLPADQQTKPRSVRLNDTRWDRLKLLGSDWLESAIDKAHLP